jgi:hypothetical protein
MQRYLITGCQTTDMRIIIVATFLLITSGCTKEPIGKHEYLNFYYKQTSCADPWGLGSSDSLTLVKVANYLNSSNLYIASLTIRNDDIAEMCLACTCKTGKTIYASTLNTDSLRAQYSRIGFKEY